MFADVARVIEGAGVVIMAIGLAAVLLRYAYDVVRARSGDFWVLAVAAVPERLDRRGMMEM